jgi:murein DD-endopeptidase MepM/ murein hydrolase activator NlpD
MPSRILIIVLLCVSFYAALLGAHAGADDQSETPTATTQQADTDPTPAATTQDLGTSGSATADSTTPDPGAGDPGAGGPGAGDPGAGDPGTGGSGGGSESGGEDTSHTEPATAPEATTSPAAPPTTNAAPTTTAPTTPAPTAKATPKPHHHSRAKKNRASAKGCLGDSSTSTRGCKKVTPVVHKRPAVTPAPTRPLTRRDGTPTASNPTASVASPGAAAIGVPNFFIDKFRIPPFLLPIYQAAGTQYGVRWEVLAAINEIETDYGRNLNISSAGALGWMQFMPATWKQYGVDANGDGLKDPFNPVDAIFAAARYLRAAGADHDLRNAIFAYNHADWYVDSVLMRARVIGGLPADLVGSLTGLTQGYFPVRAHATYAGKLKKASRNVRRTTNAAYVVQGGARRGIDIYARAGAPVIAVNDGRIVKLGHNKRLGRYVQLQDVYGNTYTYARLKTVARTYPSPKRRRVTQSEIRKELHLPKHDPTPAHAASAGSNRAKASKKRGGAFRRNPRHAAASRADGPRHTQAKTRLKDSAATGTPDTALPAAMPEKQRLFAHPERPAALAAGGDLQVEAAGYTPSFGAGVKFNPRDFEPKRLRKGARVIAGTVLGRVGRTSAKRAPHVRFEIRPAGRGAPRVDPKPILDGWKLLESTEIYRSKHRNPFFGADAATPSIGQIMLMGKETLARRVLANPRIDVYDCGRKDIQTGQVDRRVLATLEFLASSGLKPTVSSLKCGHGYLTSSGNVSEHTTGTAVDIAAINGTPIVGHQGKGSITELTIQRLLTLQGTMKPHQIISLMTFEGADNTLALADHYDHIHVGFRPLYGANAKASKQVAAVLKPKQWIKLIGRLGEIDNPTVRATPSKYALRDKRGSAAAGRGD